ncbi:hypothetical protein [Macrococcus capreoli]|uniref:hypothetical protein n=1 Tax=Macrococcus capreoli TaxID=2982690 RepID=UPI0021D60AAD|nr:hypothetical protein [Macrococcus sp. TMW 2.2395]MCU7557618.1 hypothetical protein [Macrococcus sp. TMW 2.2395]
MNDFMLDEHVMNIKSFEIKAEKEIITLIVAPSGTKKRDELDRYVKKSEQDIKNSFESDVRQFINAFMFDNKGQWVDKAMNEMENKIKLFGDIFI